MGNNLKITFSLIFVVCFMLFLSFAALFFSYVSGILLLILGIFFLRLSGQGLMAHTASTVVTRYFDKSRGKALGYIWLGMALAEFLLPIVIVYLLTLI